MSDITTAREEIQAQREALMELVLEYAAALQRQTRLYADGPWYRKTKAERGQAWDAFRKVRQLQREIDRVALINLPSPKASAP